MKKSREVQLDIGRHFLINFFLPFLMLCLYGCSEPKKADGSLEKRQEAIAKEIVLIQYAFADAVFHLNNTNAVSFVAKAESLADRLDKISNELDILGRFPMSLRKATLKKLDGDDKAFAKDIPRIPSGSLRPEVAKITNPAVERFFSASVPVGMKAGLYYSGTDTNGVELIDHP